MGMRDEGRFVHLRGMTPRERLEWEAYKRETGSAWDRMSGPAKVVVVIFGVLYFVTLPIWTLMNAP